MRMNTLRTILSILILVLGLCAPALVCADVKAAATAGLGTNLHVAAVRGDADAVQRLIRAGADLNEKDAYASTPLIIAATFGHTAVARALIQAGADLRIANGEGSSPLHIAAFFGRTDIVHLLLDSGADRYARNDAGHTPHDTVAVPFDDVAPAYAHIEAGLAPLGLRLDHERLRSVRSTLAQLLRPLPEDLKAVKYTPLQRAGWDVSTPAAEGLDSRLVAELYFNAASVKTLYGLLVLRHGRLIAEGYFGPAGIDQLSGRQSMTKSVTSAMVGMALKEGCLSSVEQKMIDFFPEFADKIQDPRKRRITIRQLLEMRAGYAWEGRTPPFFDILFMRGDWHWLPHIVDFPLVSDPGAAFAYSNLSSHLLAVIVQRVCGRDLKSFSQARLFAPLHARVAKWSSDPDGYNWGWGEIYLTARDMVRFGQLYLRGGRCEGRQIVPGDWVGKSLQPHSQGINIDGANGSAAGL